MNLRKGSSAKPTGRMAGKDRELELKFEVPLADEPAAEEEPPAEEESPAPKKAAKKGRGRASVPSWDEIMFGGGRSE